MKKFKSNVLFIEMESHPTEMDNFMVKTTIVDLDFYVPDVDPSRSLVLVKINGNNMEPTIFSGEVVVCQKLQKSLFQPEETAAVIITKKGIMVKRIYKHAKDNSFLIRNDNSVIKEWEEIEKNEILQLLIIKEKLNHGIIFHNANKRISALKNSVDHIKKEIVRIDKGLTQLEN